MNKLGINMLTTMLLLVFLSFIGMFMITNYKTSSQRTNKLYLNTYANNLLKSATEFSILNVLGHNFKNGCPNTFTINDPLFKVTGYYHFYLTNCENCNSCSVIKTKDVNGSFLISIFVKSTVPGFNIQKHKTTLQNP